MRHGDLDAVLLLFDQVAAEGLWIGTEPGYDRERYREIFGFAMSVNNGMFVAESDGSLVGILTTYRHEEYGWTLGMMVDERHRGRGVGRALMDALFAWARGKGIARLSLLVFPHNERALALYRSSGFVEKERYPNDVMRRNGEHWDSILMQKELT
jgi:ribosomal protein S18 acetylase RimI-like enzyme